MGKQRWLNMKAKNDTNDSRIDNNSSTEETTPDKPVSYNEFYRKEIKTRNWFYSTLFTLLFLAIIRIISNVKSTYYAALFFDAVQLTSIICFGLLGTLRK